MPSLSLKIVQDNGAVTRKVKFDSRMTVKQAHDLVKDKVNVPDKGKEYALFLRSADDELSGVWLENDRTLDNYMLRDGDSLDYLCKIRNLRVKLSDDTVKTIPVDESKTVGELMYNICVRVGITNYDEYGLCHEEEEETDEGKENKATATLTLKRKPPTKERDVVLEQLSKRLKTDDNVEWLDQNRTLREQNIDVAQTLLLKRRLFYTDRNVDARDPLQLNLLYVGTRDDILIGKHPVTEQQAVEFAGIQCQVNFGDYQDQKHKPGFIENLQEYLPEQYLNAWGVEKKILKAYSQHQGVSHLEAKYLYVKTARALPTFGVTFFLVKEQQKGKKKLVPRLLGINWEAILRLDEVTKEILQQWPLTHVKTYHAGKSQTFTLNFGDYSDKEYCVKTQDAYRIRDILEGYIDLISKRLRAKPLGDCGESMVICQDNIQPGQSNSIQYVSNNASKLVTDSCVGPTKIVPFSQGSQPQQCTQIMTVQQIVVSDLLQNRQHALKGEVPIRGDMSVDCARKLNGLNSNSVKIVTLLTDPTDANMNEAREILKIMQQDLPEVEQGVKETAEKQTVDSVKKMLLDELEDLNTYMNKLEDSMKPEDANPANAKDAAENIADLTTQIYFSIDPTTRRRSDYCRRSRKSFKADEKKEQAMRRPSFKVAATSAMQAVDDAGIAIHEEYKGPKVDDEERKRLEKSLQAKMGKLNAAVALYLTAHADPENIDYAAAINSMNAINELMPELARDAQMLGSTKDEEGRKVLQDDMDTLLQATKKVCGITAADDHDKIQEASNTYADIAGKLIFTFARGTNAPKENEIIDLAKDAGVKASQLLVAANELTCQAANEPAAADVDDAGVKTAGAARDLMACAQLTAPAIHEPHCQSALTAAAARLRGAAALMEAAWKPLTEHPTRHHMQDELRTRTACLNQALEKLTDAYGSLDNMDIDDPDDASLPLRDRQHLKFINTIAGVKNGLQGVEDLWNKSATGAPSADQRTQARQRLEQKMAQLNAAVAALAAATADRENPDYDTAEMAINTISELMPQIVKDTEVVSSDKDDATRNAMLKNVAALCDATRDMCDGAGYQHGQGDAGANFAAASRKLVFLVSPGADKGKEKQIMQLSSDANDSALDLVSQAQELRPGLSPFEVAELDKHGAAVQDAAHALDAVARVTAPCMGSPRCQDALAAAAQRLRSAAAALGAVCQPHLAQAPELAAQRMWSTEEHLNDTLDELQRACQAADTDHIPHETAVQREKQRIKFVNSISGAKNRLYDAQQQLKQPMLCQMMKQEDGAALENKLSKRLAQLNAAIAALAAATADRENPDYAAADEAIKTITELMPQMIQDSRKVCGSKEPAEQAAMLQELQALCQASSELCEGAAQTQGMGQAAGKYSAASGKLMFLLSPADNEHANKVLDLATASCGKASELLAQVQQLSQQVPAADAAQLDASGARTADAAQALITVAEATSSSISDPACSSTLVSAAERLRSAAAELSAVTQPCLQHAPELQQHMTNTSQDLDRSLDELVQACQEGCDNLGGVSPAQQEKRRLKFVSSVSGAKKSIDSAEQQLKEPMLCQMMRQENGAALEHKLSQRLAQLNAAVAALAAATADRENPDYAAADKAVTTISELMPQVMQESRVLCGSKDKAGQDAMLQQLRALCDASREICENAGQPQGLNDAAAKFSAASGKLVYIVSPKSSGAHEKKVMDLSAAACGKASDLLSQVQTLTEKVADKDAAALLDTQGARTADAAQALFTVAMVTSPSISDASCSTKLVTAAESLRDSASLLTDSCRPHLLTPESQTHMMKAKEQLDDSLDKVVQACQEGSGNLCVEPSAQQEKRRLKFVSSVSGAKKSIDSAEQQLKEPMLCQMMRQEDGAALEHKLSQRLAQLNAAVAALAAATADRENPDYAAADKAVTTISELMPQVVQESRVVCGSKDKAGQDAMLQQLRALCDASREICENAGQPQGLNDAAAKFSAASGKMVYIVSPKSSGAHEKKVMDLSAAACGKASDLLSQVQTLTEKVADKDAAALLDTQGARTADAAQALFTVAMVTSPSISDASCSTKLVTAAEGLRDSASLLTDSCRPHLLTPESQKDMMKAKEQLDDSLDKVVQACQEGSGNLCVESPAQQEKRRLKFVSSVSGAKKSIDSAQQQLKEPMLCQLMRQEDGAALEHKLSQRLAQLNAAVAALAAATADRENPDYAAADKAVTTISELMPQVVQESRVVCGSKDKAGQDAMLQQLRALCDASREICENAGQPQGLNDAAAKFSAASGKMVYIVSPKSSGAHEKKVMNLSAAACGKASDLLSQVQTLTEKVADKDAAALLDTQGARTADAAQALFTVATVTSPSISDASCSTKLVTAAESLRDSASLLTDSCRPHLLTPESQTHMIKAKEQLDDSLDKVVQACQEGSGNLCVVSPAQQEKRRLKFVSSVSGAKKSIQSAEQQLKEPMLCQLMRQEDGAALEHKLSQRLAQLNAAVAALAAATADRENPDYVAANQAVTTISELMPQVVQESRVVCGSKDKAGQDAMLQQLRALCDASREICENAGQPQGLNDAAAKFSAASGKMVYIVSPKSSGAHEKKVMNLSAAACGKASNLLSQVQTLTEKVADKDAAALLDTQGARTADAAQALFTVATVTSPSISDASCSTKLVTAAESLRDSASLLTDSCRPHLLTPESQTYMIKTKEQLDDSLDKVVQACQEGSGNLCVVSPAQQEKRRLKFVSSVSGAKKSIQSAEQQLKEPMLCQLMRQEDGAALEHKLSQRLAQLNAAVAALAAATADRENPDYVAANQAVTTISELMPQVVQESRVVCGSKDKAGQDAMLQQLRALCDASREICENAGQPQGLNDAAAKFSAASGKMVYIVSPKSSGAHEKKVMDLSAAACGKASDLLSQVQTLTEKVADKDAAALLDAQGARTADAAQALFTVATVTSPSISDASCSTKLVTAAESLRDSASLLTDSCRPHLLTPESQKDMMKTKEQLDDSLDKVVQACQEGSGNLCVISPAQQEKRRLKFVSSVSGAKKSIQSAEQQLKEPMLCQMMRQEDGAALEHKLSQRLAQLNAAVAALAAATADRENPDYAAANRAVKDISELMPQVMQESRVICGSKDKAGQDAMLQQLRALCDASREICENAGQPQGLSNAAAKFSAASGKLVFTVSPKSKGAHEKKVMELSAAASDKASKLFSQVHDLTEKVADSDVVALLDTQGARTANAAQALLTVATITSPTISEPSCATKLVSAAEHLRDSASLLTDSCRPHLRTPESRQYMEDTREQLDDSLDELVHACQEGCGGNLVEVSPRQLEKRRLKYISSMSGVKRSLDAAEKQIKMPLASKSMKPEDTGALKDKLSDRLAQLRAAIAALTAANADRRNPDYVAANRAVKTISELLPQVVQDSRSLCSDKDEPAQKAVSHQLQALCEASRQICDDSLNQQGLGDAISKFAAASNEMDQLVHPKVDDKHEKQVLNLTALACGKSSELLSQVQTLSEKVADGDAAAFLDNQGARTADATESLLNVAQVTAPRISSPDCATSLISSAQKLRNSAKDLTASCRPHLELRPELKKPVLDGEKQLDDSLKQLIQACEAGIQGAEKPLSPEKEIERQEFVTKVSGARNHLATAEQHLKQPVVSQPLKAEESAKLQHQLSRRLAQLNAAVAALAAATCDIPENPDYPAAERAVITISELMPQVIQASHTLCSGKDSAGQAAMMQQLNALCDASRDICNSAGQPGKLHEASAKLANVSGKLLVLVKPEEAEINEQTKAPKPKPSAKKPDVPVRSSSTSSSGKPHSVVQPVPAGKAGHDTQHFLDMMREGENVTKVKVVSMDEKVPFDKAAFDEYAQLVEAAEKRLDSAEKSLTVLYNAKNVSVAGGLTAVEVTTKEQHMEDMLARAGVQVASIVAANYADKLDYKAAMEPTEALTQSVYKVIDDGSMISSTLPEHARKPFINDLSGLCKATKELCQAAKGNKKKLNDAAISFGDRSAKLLRVVSCDVNPTLEKEVMSRAKAIGDTASRLALEASNVAGSSNVASSTGADGQSYVQDICSAGAQCVDSAGKLVYTARLVAPTIHHSTCQDTLVSSADNLSSSLTAFSNTWKPLASAQEPNVQKLTEEAGNLEKLVDKLRSEVKGGKLGKRRESVRLVDVNTPLRQMTVQIIDNAKNMSEHGELQPELRKQYSDYSNRLAEAVRALDLANARLQRAPHDKNKRNEMEIAIQDLQMMLLQTRPSRTGQELNNIVDFRDFLQDLVKEADELQATATKNEGPAGKRVTDDIKILCSKISEDANRMLNPQDQQDDSVTVMTSVDDIMDIDQFGQECDLLVKEINLSIQGIQDQKAKQALRAKALPLNESCNLLRFATNSHISATKSAVFEEVLQDLDNFQDNVIKPLIDNVINKNKKENKGYYSRRCADGAGGAARLAARRAAGGAPHYVIRALTQYASVTAASASPDHVDVLNNHLNYVVDQVSAVTSSSSQKLANWSTDYPEEISSNLIEDYEFKSVPKPDVKVLNDEDLDKLLVCKRAKVEGTQKQLEDKVQQLSTKLSSMSGTIILSVKTPSSLSRSLHATADVAAELANTARGLKVHKKSVQNQKIEEAAHEMCFATYSLLKTSELVCQEPNHHDSRRKLRDACQHLNDCINKLVRSVNPVGKLSQECSEVQRSLQLQRSSLQAPPQPVGALPYADCLDNLYEQRDVLQKLNNNQEMSRAQFLQSMQYVASAVSNATDCGAHASYLLSVSEKDASLAKEGIVDVPKLHKAVDAVQDSCVSIIMAHQEEQIQDEKKVLEKDVKELLEGLDDAVNKAKDNEVKTMMKSCREDIDLSAKAFYKAVTEKKPKEALKSLTMSLMDDVNNAANLIEHPNLVPTVGEVSQDTQQRCEEVVKNSIALISHTEELMKQVKSSDQPEVMKWVMFNKKKDVLDAFDALLKSIKSNGHRANLLEGSMEDLEEEKKSYVQKQFDAALKWLHKPMVKSEVKNNGQQAVRNLIDVANKVSEDLQGSDKEDMRHLIVETEQLLTECSKKYDQEQYSVLMERVRELKKGIERGVVTRVVEDFMEAEEPLQDLDIIADAERDETKRKFILEKKIAELLAHLSRVTKTARLIADTDSSDKTAVSNQLNTCSQQAELLAPMLVKAAQQRVSFPDDKAVIDNYKSLLARYAESLSKIRDLCDQSVDPMDFVQTAGETMQRMRDESKQHNDPMKCAHTSMAITKLANRVIHVGISSQTARGDPELQKAMSEAHQQLTAATPAPDTRASKMPDWKDTTAKILQATEEVEGLLRGENVFKKQPEPNQPIYNEALNLHVAIRDWSSRDNEIVAVAKRMAVLMAKLSNYMNNDKQREVLATSKSIVMESHEVARLARKMAHECTDHRIKTNLLQACERIPTISGQLKMLTTVKGFSLGRHGTQEDKEAMDMLVGNAQSLMISIQDVVKGAASASVKIMSQRGPKMKWVRKNTYCV